MPEPPPSPRRARRAVVVVAAAVAVMAGGAGIATAAGAAPATGLFGMTSPVLPPGAGPGAQGASDKQGGLEALVTTVDTVRAGGRGMAIVDVAQKSTEGITARQVRVRISGRGGVTATGAAGTGWACAPARGAIECSRARLAPWDTAAPIRVAMVAGTGLRNGTAPLRAEVTWREPAGSRRPGTRRATARRPVTSYSDVTAARLETDARLGVSVRASGAMLALDTPGDAAHLAARVTGLDGTTATLDWRQACLTPQEAAADAQCRGRVAPPARFISPQHVADAADVEIAAVELPLTDGPRNLMFEATVREGGAVATGRVTITSRPVRTPTYDPGIDSLDKLRAIRPADPAQMAVRPSQIIRGGVGSRGPTRLVPGRPATITARVPGRQIRQVSWRVVGDGRQLLAGAQRTGASLRVTAPSGLAGAVITLVATTALTDGTSVELAELVTVTAPPRAGPRTTASGNVRASARAALERTAALGRRAMSRPNDSAGPDATVCDIADRVSRGALQPVPRDANGASPGYPDTPPDDTAPPDVMLGETGLLWLGKATATTQDGRCSVAFESAELHYGDYVFVQVSGRITREGLRILGGAFNPPEKWLEASGSLRDAVTQAAGSVLRFSVPEDSAVRLGAGIAPSGEWRSLSGELSIDAGLSLLPLPNGWRFRPAALELDVEGIMSLTLVATAPEGESGSVSIRGSAGGGGSMSLEVEAAGLVVMQQVVTDPATGAAVVDAATGRAKMSQVTANLGGEFLMNFYDTPSAPAGQPVRFGLSTTIRGSLENLVLASNFTVERIGFEWTPGRISADARVRAGRGPQPQAVLAGAGAYRGSDDWSVEISAQPAWQVTPQLRIDSLQGSMQRKAGRTSISARGSASGWPQSGSFEFDSIRAELTNACPVPAVAGRECRDATARVELDARGRVRLPQFATDSGESMPWTSTASIDLSTRIFTLTGGLTSASGIGPAELKLTGVAIQLSNDTSRQWCTREGVDPTAKGDVRLGITATGEVFGKTVEFSGEFGGQAGLCLVGRMGTMPSDVPSASLFREVQVAYTSEKVMVNLPGGVPRPAGRREMSVYADFTLPAGVERAASGEYFLMGTLGLGDRSIRAAVGVTYPSNGRKIIAGSASGSHLALSGVDFAFVWSRTDLAASATARMDYVTPAGPGSDIGASTTPLAGTLAFDLRRASFSVEARVDSQRAPGGVVGNAFGVVDLSVKQLGIRGSVGADTSISFSADVALPERWVGAIGVKAGTRQMLDFSISQTDPCLRIALRRPDGDDTGVAVDLANARLVTAHEVGLTIAPLGCRLPGNQVVEPGFGFVFDGYLAGVFRVNINARVSLPTPQNPRLAVFTHAEIGALDLGGVAKFDQTLLDIDIDTSAGRYKVGFSGGLDIIGNRVGLSVSLAAENGRVNFAAHADQNLNVVGFGFTGTQDLRFGVANGNVERFVIHVNLNATVLGVSLARLAIDFDYDDGQVRKWYFSTGITVPLIVASAGGDVTFDYALHRKPGREETTDPFVRKTFDIGVGGRLRFLFWSTSFHWNVFHYEGALAGTGREGVNSDVVEKQKEPEPPALPQVGWTWMKGETWSTRVAVSSVTYKVRYTTTSSGSDAPQMLMRGGIDITTCEVSTATGECVPGRDEAKDPRFIANIDFVNRKIIIQEGQADCSAPMRGYCSDWRDVVLDGDDWQAMVKWIEAARRTYAEQPDNKRAGKVLPPIKHWTVSPVPTSLGWAEFRDNRAGLRWGLTRGISDAIRPSTDVVPAGSPFAGASALGVTRATGIRLQRLKEGAPAAYDAPGRGVPVVADWDGDGATGLGLWYGRSYEAYGYNAAGLWLMLHDGGGTEAMDDPGTCPAFCQPIEPPGTVAYERTSRNNREGASGAAFPVAGNWDGFEKDGSAADTPGLATYEGGGTMRWVLRPASGPPISVDFGYSNIFAQPVPRPVTGDWNGDGITDIGVYDPPARPGDTGGFRLLTSLRYPASPDVPEPDPDITIAMGSYGSMPVTGDWNGDHITDVGTVTRPDANGRATWNLRYVRSENCTADCAPDAVVTTSGAPDMVPLAGAWR